MQMAVPSAARDRDRKREAFMSVQNDDDDQESDKGEEEEWESQQIRKGVTGAQVGFQFLRVSFVPYLYCCSHCLSVFVYEVGCCSARKFVSATVHNTNSTTG